MRYGILAAAMLIAAALPARAQPSGPPIDAIASIAEAEAADQGAAPLPFVATAPDCGFEQWYNFVGERSVRNISRPALLPVLPPKSVPVRAAIIVAPGGGFTGLRFEGEGTAVAQRLAQSGIAAFVLKYRVQCTPRPVADFISSLRADMTRKRTWGDADFPQFAASLADAHEAIRYVRSHAADYGVDPKRIGLMGFSAGAITTLSAAQTTGEPGAPDFAIAIYPQMNSPLRIPDHPAPLFLALAGDDSLFGRQGTALIDRWQKAGGSVEFHLFEAGEHGFALSQRGITSDHWFEELLWWLKARKIANP